MAKPSHPMGNGRGRSRLNESLSSISPFERRSRCEDWPGGSCPKDLDEVLALPHNDCLIAVFHVADGYS